MKATRTLHDLGQSLLARQYHAQLVEKGRPPPEVLARFAGARIDVHTLSAQLQDEGRQVVRPFVERFDGRDRLQIRPPRASELAQ